MIHINSALARRVYGQPDYAAMMDVGGAAEGEITRPERRSEEAHEWK
jgi:hypothetical protein